MQDAIAAALTQLAHDPALRQDLGRVGSRTVHQNFTLEHNVGQVKNWLLSVLRNPIQFPSSQTLSPTLEAVIR